MKKSPHRHRDRRRLRKVRDNGIVSATRTFLPRTDLLPRFTPMPPGTFTTITTSAGRSAWMWNADGSLVRVE
jgi:hypothetical protein